jgi:hypothetical protein
MEELEKVPKELKGSTIL